MRHQQVYVKWRYVLQIVKKTFTYQQKLFLVRPSGPLDSSEEIEGANLETLCFQEIKAINDYFNYQYDLYYWRTSNGIEVDIVLYGPKGILAFEMKRSKRITKKDLSGLKVFKSDFPEATLYLLYGRKSPL
jgi:predicted AAA+ superfamily ATPase